MFLLDDFNFGVVQRGTVGRLGGTEMTDAYAYWSGASVRTDFAGFEVAGATLSVLDTGTFAGNAGFGVEVSGSMHLDSSERGRFRGTFSGDDGDGTLTAILSPESEFAGVWACGSSFPDSCSFLALD